MRAIHNGKNASLPGALADLCYQEDQSRGTDDLTQENDLGLGIHPGSKGFDEGFRGGHLQRNGLLTIGIFEQ
jgi:hypothetical protein